MTNTTRFALGRVLATPGALATFDQPFLSACLQRHTEGDWGDLEAEDRESNEEGLHAEERLFSVYKQGDRALWIVTEADRAATTLLLPSEY